jgi:hypothetical protein
MILNDCRTQNSIQCCEASCETCRLGIPFNNIRARKFIWAFLLRVGDSLPGLPGLKLLRKISTCICSSEVCVPERVHDYAYLIVSRTQESSFVLADTIQACKDFVAVEYYFLLNTLLLFYF